MKDRYTSKEPLMYIAQSPKIHPPKVDMQAVYSIKREKKIGAGRRNGTGNNSKRTRWQEGAGNQKNEKEKN